MPATATSFGTTGTAATSPSANTSAETVFVRRAFTYLASDKAGIVRFGQADGVLGLFDNCIFTSQCWDAGHHRRERRSDCSPRRLAGAVGCRSSG